MAEQVRPDAPSGALRASSRWALALRVGSSVLFIPLLVLLARAGGIAFWAFVALEVTLGLAEFYRMMRGRGLNPFQLLGMVSALGLLWVSYRPHTPHVGFMVTAVLLLVLGLELRRPELRQRVEDIAVTSFGVLYVGWLSAHFVLLRELPWQVGAGYAEGASFVLLAFFMTWSCDTAAYAIGRSVGRYRPFTRISPRKSLEGSLGGLVAAVAAGLIARQWFAPYLRTIDAVLLGLLVGLFAQVGDLVESLLKRDAAHGDSSDFIPGHGGVLDRFDSLYFAAPVVYYYLQIVVYRVP
ncbi:MAG TPA: phosphatidate cytidylyltransferase [Candidatus Eisenbacteria bacterium]|nr:phosphatidate cytidylyltransferase [Candidatus Eisenbacteria bacterium]